MTGPGPWDHPEAREYAARFNREVMPQLRRSALSLALVGPDADLDVKQATEIGASLLLGKPLVLLVRPGSHIPDGLAAAAAAIVEFDPDDPDGTAARIGAAITDFDPPEKTTEA